MQQHNQMSIEVLKKHKFCEKILFSDNILVCHQNIIQNLLTKVRKNKNVHDITTDKNPETAEKGLNGEWKYE